MSMLLEAQDMMYTYPSTDRPALNGLSLAIPAGSKTAICGHNGCGKSTFFLHSNGILRPQSGRLQWKGTDYSYRKADIHALRQRIGLVFQDPEQQLILNTPYEDISYGLRNAGFPEEEIRRRVEQMLVRMGLMHLADQPIHHLSLGQKKRVTLAGILVLEPELILLDEPTAYLDPKSEVQLLEQLDRIHAQGVTIAMSTHDMNLVYTWADWVIVMDQGRVVLSGTPLDVFQQTDTLMTLGLRIPMLYDLWLALPESWRNGAAPPRDMEAFKAWVSTHHILQ
jgi:cobalt/nickel transport system ATP-binding protein